MPPTNLFRALPDLVTELADLVRQIPFGRVATFGDVARALGDIAAAKWVAKAIVEDTFPARDLSHRVVRQTGESGPASNDDPATKLERLSAESVPFVDDRVSLAECRFSGFRSSAPLDRLRRQQEELRHEILVGPLQEFPLEVAGLDVSYESDGTAVAAYVLMRTDASEPIWTATARVSAPFPYITGYLAFREIPAHLAVIDQARRARKLAPVLLIDGNGILHPRRCGVATQLGVILSHPTIGVAKKLLHGSIKNNGDISDSDGPLGRILTASEKSRPIFVSPGHRCDIASAESIARSCFAGHRLPEPLYLADRLSREEARRSSP